MFSDPPGPVRTQDGLTAWRALTSRPDQGLVALDYDGTLAPIVPRPEDARAQPGTVDALTALVVAGVRVVVVTGRPAATAVALGGLDAVPGLVVLGHYGLQHWQDGRLTTPAPAPGVATARAALEAYAEQQADGVAVEDKHHSVALHTRNADDPSGAFEAARPVLARLAHDTGLELVPGRFVLELRPAGTDKGGALRRLLRDTGARAVLLAGDDLGDLPAVDALDEARAAGVACLVVCSDSPETPASLRERSDLVVAGPPGVVATLQALADSVRA